MLHYNIYIGLYDIIIIVWIITDDICPLGERRGSAKSGGDVSCEQLATTDLKSCYELEAACCQSCPANAKTHLEESCRYGDQATYCSLVLSANWCDRLEVFSTQCCDTCCAALGGTSCSPWLVNHCCNLSLINLTHYPNIQISKYSNQVHIYKWTVLKIFDPSICAGLFPYKIVFCSYTSYFLTVVDTYWNGTVEAKTTY